MRKEEKLTIEDHKRYMDENVQQYLKPMMVDILKRRPSNVLEFIMDWCQTKGVQIQKAKPAEEPVVVEEQTHIEDVAKGQIRKSVQEILVPPVPPKPDIASSEDEEEHGDFDEEEENKKLNDRASTTKKKMAISAEVYGDFNQQEEFNPPVIEKTEEQMAKIKEVLGMNFMFADLEEKEQEIIIKAMSIRNYEADDNVIRQGDDGAELFVVGSGQLECTKLFEGKEEETFLKNYKVGDVFGELALMYNAPRAAKIVAKEPSVLFSLDRGTFNHIVKSSTIKRRETYDAFLSKIDILSDLDVTEKAKICDCLKKEVFSEGQNIINEGEEGDRFYMIQSGEATAFQKQEDGTEKSVFKYKENDYFGELALLNNDKRKATIRVTSDKMIVASLDSQSFKRLLGPIEDILQRNSSKYEKYMTG